MTNRRPPDGVSPEFEGYHYPDAHGPRAGGPRRRPPQRGPSGIVLGLIYGGIGLLALAVGAITFVMMAPPTDLIRREIVSQVRSATGRELTIAQASFTFFPTLGVRARDVALSAPPGMGGAPLLKAASIDVGVRLLPLLRQEIIVDRLVLHDPVFALRVDGQGRKSWDMAAVTRAHPVRQARAGSGSSNVDWLGGFVGAAHAQGRMPDIAELSLGDIRIENGTIGYQDERTGNSYRIDAINAQAGLESLAQPLDATGDLVWANETITFDGKLTTPGDVLQERPAKLAVKISGRPVRLTYDGTVALRDSASAEGVVDGEADSLRALAQWLGTQLPPGPGFGKVAFAGNVRAGQSSVRLSEARLALDGATATGTISANTSGVRPLIVGDLKVSNLNLNNYVDSASGGAQTGSQTRTRAPAPARAAPPSAAPDQQAPQSIEDLLKHPGTEVRGYTKQNGAWATTPLDTSGLNLLDAKVKLSVNGLRYAKLRVDSSELSVDLKDRVLKTTFESLRLYNGNGAGFVALDGSGPEAVLGANMVLKGIAAAPLLNDAVGIGWLAGKGDVEIAVSGRGASQATIVSSLNGQSSIAVRDGALIGFNLAGAMRALSQGRIPDFDSSPSERTDFSELTGSFVITNGIAENSDMLLQSPLLRATGAGTVDLPRRSLDYIVRPKVVASLAGQGGAQDLKGLEVPLRITGPLDDPVIQPDVASAINNPDTIETVKEIGKQFKGKNAGEIVEDLFGKGEDGGPSKAEKLLENFLGR